MEPQRVESRAEESTIDWGRALFAGLIATALITVTMGLGGQNIMKMLGGMVVPGASTGVQYALGGATTAGTRAAAESGHANIWQGKWPRRNLLADGSAGLPPRSPEPRPQRAA